MHVVDVACIRAAAEPNDGNPGGAEAVRGGAGKKDMPGVRAEALHIPASKGG